MKKIILLLFLILHIIGCKNKKSDLNISSQDTSIQEISVNAQIQNNINLSDVFDKISYTLLETKDQFLVGDVDRMKVVDGKLYLLSSKRLMSFDTNNGRPYLSIQKLGYSQEEYISLYDMYIDSESKKIELLDMNGKKIKIYNYEGNYIKSIPLPFFSISFTKINENEYFLYNNNLSSDISNSSLSHFNAKTQNILHEYLEIDKNLAEYFFVVEGNNFNNGEKRTFFSCPSNIIYEITNNYSIKPIYKISYGSNQPPADFYKEKYSDIADFAQKANDRNYIYFTNDLVENNNFISFGFRLSDQQYWSIFDKRTNKTITGSHMIDDITNHLCKYNIEYNNFPFAIDNEKLYFLLQPHQFIETMNKIKTSLDDKKFNEFIKNKNNIKEILQSDGFNDQSNPILVTCNFKTNE